MLILLFIENGRNSITPQRDIINLHILDAPPKVTSVDTASSEFLDFGVWKTSNI